MLTARAALASDGISVKRCRVTGSNIQCYLALPKRQKVKMKV